MYTQIVTYTNHPQLSPYVYGVCALVVWLVLPLFVLAAEVDDALKFFPSGQISKQIYVSPSGNDNAAGTQSAPKRSLQAALNAATPGTAVMVTPGTYQGNFELTKSGTKSQPIILVSAGGPGAATLTSQNRYKATVNLRFVSYVGVYGVRVVGNQRDLRSDQEGRLGYTDAQMNEIYSNGYKGVNDEGPFKMNRTGYTVIARNIISGTGVDGIKYAGGDGPSYVIGNVFDGAFDENHIDAVIADNIVVKHNDFRGGSTLGPFNFKNGSWNVEFSNNLIDVRPIHPGFRNNGYGLMPGGHGAGTPGDDQTRTADARYVSIKENVFLGEFAWRSVELTGARDATIERNYFCNAKGGTTIFGVAESTMQPAGESVIRHDSRNNTARNNIYCSRMTIGTIGANSIMMNNRIGALSDVEWKYGVSGFGGASPVISTPTPPLDATPCGDYQSPTTPTGYGSAYNHFSGEQEVIVEASCTDTGFTPFTGSYSTNQTNFAVYNQGYYWTGTQWRPYTFAPVSGLALASTKNPGWILGPGAAPLIPYQGATTYFVAYTCHFGPGQAPKCGCSDSTCATPKWQVQKVVW